MYDTSSVSSSSRESSAYPRCSVSSSTTTTRESRTLRTKRGSESQEPNSDRRSKRATRSETQPDLSDAKRQTFCETFDSCWDPKNHVRKVKKIVKEKSARNDQAKVLQHLEDTLEIVCNWRSPKEQKPGNQKRSGLVGDKQHDLVATFFGFDFALEWIARRDDLHAFLQELRPRIDSHIASDSPQDLPAGSLLAARTVSEKRRCTDDPSHRSCDNPIDCRKAARRMQSQINLGHCMRDSAARVQKRSPTTGTSARASLSRRH